MEKVKNTIEKKPTPNQQPLVSFFYHNVDGEQDSILLQPRDTVREKYGNYKNNAK